MIGKGGSRWHLVRQKRRAAFLVVFVPLNTALLVVFVVGLLCACPRCFLAAHMVDTMNFRVYSLGSMNFSVVAHSPRIPLGKQLNVPQPGFSPLLKVRYIYIYYIIYIYIILLLVNTCVSVYTCVSL